MRKVLQLALVLGVVGLVAAQSVAGLRQASWNLPQTSTDNAVVSEFFGALSAVQVACSQSMQASLAQEGALAACARLGEYFTAEVGRSLVDLKLRTLGSWVSPWQEAAGLGTVRRLAAGASEFYLAIDERAGFAYVIRFVD